MTTSRVTTSRAPRIALGLLLACLLGVVFGQIDVRSQQLLDGMAPTTSTPLSSIDQTMLTTVYQAGQDPITTSTRTVIDFANERAAILAELAEGMSSRLVYADGKATMAIPGMPIKLPAPPEMAAAFATMFDPPQDVAAQPDAKATYDGVVSYGDVVSGQQVTYTGTYDLSGTPTDSTFQFIFDDAGTLIATVHDVPDSGQMIMVFDGPAGTDPRVGRDMIIYDFDGTNGTMISKTHYENVSINEPLDETVFE